MPVRTTMTTGWRIRLGGITILFALMGGWFLLDGLNGYPREQAIFDEFDTFRQTNQESNPKWQEAWDAVAETKGYPAVEWRKGEEKWYEDLKHDANDILLQCVLGFVVLPLAAWFGFLWMQSGKRWIEADDDGIHIQTGERANWDQFVKLDKRRWPKKGIAVLHFMDDAAAAAAARNAALSTSDSKSGSTETTTPAPAAVATKTITLDDWKFEPTTTKAVLMAIESHIDAGLIVGDITEAERDAKKKAEAEAAAASTDADPGEDADSDTSSDESHLGETVEDDKPEHVA